MNEDPNTVVDPIKKSLIRRNPSSCANSTQQRMRDGKKDTNLLVSVSVFVCVSVCGLACFALFENRMRKIHDNLLIIQAVYFPKTLTINVFQ